MDTQIDLISHMIKPESIMTAIGYPTSGIDPVAVGDIIATEVRGDRIDSIITDYLRRFLQRQVPKGSVCTSSGSSSMMFLKFFATFLIRHFADFA